MKKKEELKKQFKENQERIQQLTEQNLMIKGYIEALNDLEKENKEDNKKENGE